MNDWSKHKKDLPPEGDSHWNLLDADMERIWGGGPEEAPHWLHYDKDGAKIKVSAWICRQADRDYARVAETNIGPYWVSTVWLGIDHNFSSVGPPLVFETMVFDHGGTGEDIATDLQMERYATEAAALAGHDRMCALVRDWVQRRGLS